VACHSFRQHQRLLKSVDFQRVFDDVQIKAGSSQLLILARFRGATLPARLGLIIPKKHLRLSVQRNEVKRVIRESFRAHQLSLSGLDLLVLARAGIVSADKKQQRAIINKSWVRITEKKKGLGDKLNALNGELHS